MQGTSRSSKATLLSKDAGHAPRALATAFLALPTGRFGATHASSRLERMMRYSDTADVLSWDDEEDMDDVDEDLATVLSGLSYPFPAYLMSQPSGLATAPRFRLSRATRRMGPAGPRTA